MATTLPEALADGLRLPTELTIYTAAETRAAWLAWLGDGADGDAPECVVDASACGEIDAAGAQLLVALAHSLAQRQRRLRLTDPADVLRAACTELGLDALLLEADPAEAAR